MKIIIGGDVSPSGALNDCIKKGNYDLIAKEVKPLFEDADFSIVNFETVIAEENDIAIEKIGPNLKTIPQVIDLLKWMGVKAVTLANNHVGDYGPSALLKTCRELELNGIQYVGVGSNKQSAAKPLLIKKEDVTVSVINCCEHEYGSVEEGKFGSNLLNPIQLFYDISNAKQSADHVIVIVHGGPENFSLPSMRMQDTYRFLIDCGADAVINGHQHCISGVEIYKNKPIYYGIGNLLFYPREPEVPIGWTEGMMVELNITADRIAHHYIPYTQCKNSLSIELLHNKTAFDLRVKELSDIIKDRKKLEEYVNDYYKKSISSIDRKIQPWNGRIMRGLYSRGLLPPIIKKQSLRRIENVVNCESHLDKFYYFLTII